MSFLKTKNFYLYGLLILLSAKPLELFIWHTNQPTLSNVAATNGVSRLIDTAAVITSAILTLLFLRKWFFKKTSVNKLKRILFYLAITLMVVAAVVPASSGSTLRTHRVVAVLMSITIVSILFSYILDSKLRVKVRIYSLTCLACMILGSLLFGGILGQLLSFIFFSAFILWLTYANISTKGIEES